MDRIDEYRKIILDLIEEYKNYKPPYEELETYPVIDRDGEHYAIMRDGWRNNYRYYGCVLHFDIKDGKIWVRHDGTEHGIAEDLVERGVPKEDIVLGFHSPFQRKHTEYATS